MGNGTGAIRSDDAALAEQKLFALFHTNAQATWIGIPCPSSRRPPRSFKLEGLTGYSVRFLEDAKGAVADAFLIQPTGLYALKRKAPSP